MGNEILNTAILAGLFLLLFSLAELLYHKFKVSADFTRKLVHMGTGVLTMLFPLMLNNQWLVLLLCAGFALILLLSKRFNFLRSINAIERTSYGSILYPIAVYGCYLEYVYFNKDLMFFYLPILTLAICDPVAALVGKRWPVGHFGIGKCKKTVTGSSSFFFSSVVISFILFHFLSHESLNDVLPVTLSVAAASALTEAVSNNGIDNITIPASVVLILIFFR